MSATVHPPSNQQKFWPLKKFALGKNTHTNSNQQKASSGPGDKKTKKGTTSNNKTTEVATKTTLVTLSKQKDADSSISLQHRRGEKGSGTTLNDASSTVSKKQDQGNVTPGVSAMTTQRSRQRVSSSQNTTAHLSSKELTRQTQTQTLSRHASIKSSKKDSSSHHRQQSDDAQVPSMNTMSVPKPSLSPVTTMPTITAPQNEPTTVHTINPPASLTRSNTFCVPPPPPNPPIITTLPEINDSEVATMGATLASKPRQKLLRPTSCTSLRQMALHQALYPPSPKSRHYNTLCDPLNSNNQDLHYQYPQHIIKRSSTFNHMPPPCSSYRRSSESTLEDNLVTPNNEDDYEMTGQEYPLEGDCYYDDDDQTIYSNNILLVDVNKPPPPPSPPTRRVLKRPVSMICQRLPDSLYTTDPASYRHLQYQHHHQQNQYLHHPGIVTVGGAGDLCISSSNVNYHQDGYYTTSNDDHPSSPPPISPGSTDSGSRTSSELHRQQYHNQTNQQPLYIFPDPSSFNKKHAKRNSLQQAHHHQAHHHHIQQQQPPPQQQQQQQPLQQQQQQKSQVGTSHQRHYLSMDLLKQELESERAVVHALQRQKEAYNKDITYLCQNVDKLTKDGKEWKTKYEQEKAEKQKHQDELLAAMNKFSEATEQIKQLSHEKQILKMELDSVNNQLILEKSRKPSPRAVPMASSAATVANSLIEHYQHETLQCQDQHQQIKLIQNTMVQLLKLNIFGNSPEHSFGCNETTNGISKDHKSNHEDKDHRAGTMTRTNSVLSSASGHQQQRKVVTRSRSSSRQGSNDTNTSKASSTAADIPSSPLTTSTPINESDAPSRPHPFSDTPPRNTVSSTDLDVQLQDLVQEKELLQAEYSKIPVSGGNAICRRRREDLEAKLDEVDSKMRKIRLRIKRRHKNGHLM